VIQKLNQYLKFFQKKNKTPTPESLLEYLTLLEDNNLVTGTLTSNYNNLIEFIKISSNDNYYIFNYDWRQSLKESVNKLAKEVETLNTKGKKITILSHSAGGVIAFDYLNNYYSEIEEPVNFKHITKYITIGCPLKGSIQALTSILGLNFQTILASKDIKSICEKADIKSIYELIPDNIYNLFYYKDTKELLSDSEILDVLISNGVDESKLIDSMRYRKEFKEIKQNPNINFTFIVGCYPDASICTSFSVDKTTKQLTCNYSNSCSDGTVLVSEAIPNDNYIFKTKYVNGKHTYLTEYDDVLDILSEEIIYENKRKTVISASLINCRSSSKLEFQLFYEKDGKQHLINKILASHINFSNKTTMIDITNIFEQNKKNESFSFKTNYKYGTLKFRNATIQYQSENEVNTENIKELYVDFINPLFNSLF